MTVLVSDLQNRGSFMQFSRRYGVGYSGVFDPVVEKSVVRGWTFDPGQLRIAVGNRITALEQFTKNEASPHRDLRLKQLDELRALYSQISPSIAPVGPVYGAKGATAWNEKTQAYVPVGPQYEVPPPPHPQGSDQSIGPNKGGADGVFLPGDMPQVPGGSGGGIALLVGAGLLAFLLLKRK